MAKVYLPSVAIQESDTIPLRAVSTAIISPGPQGLLLFNLDISPIGSTECSDSIHNTVTLRKVMRQSELTNLPMVFKCIFFRDYHDGYFTISIKRGRGKERCMHLVENGDVRYKVHLLLVCLRSGQTTMDVRLQKIDVHSFVE